jgi:hypothetical protein
MKRKSQKLLKENYDFNELDSNYLSKSFQVVYFSKAHPNAKI